MMLQLQRFYPILVSQIAVSIFYFTKTHASLATRGADFGDGSVYITYRNVSPFFLSSIHLVLIAPLAASHSERHRSTRCSACGMDG